MALLSDGLRGGGSMDATPEGEAASTGDSVKLSNKLGVEEHERPFVATLPKRKAGSEVSALAGRCGMLLVENPLCRDNEGRVAGRLRLQDSHQ